MLYIMRYPTGEILAKNPPVPRTIGSSPGQIDNIAVLSKPNFDNPMGTTVSIIKASPALKPISFQNRELCLVISFKDPF
jgi:hypothetical protein